PIPDPEGRERGRVEGHPLKTEQVEQENKRAPKSWVGGLGESGGCEDVVLGDGAPIQGHLLHNEADGRHDRRAESKRASSEAQRLEQLPEMPLGPCLDLADALARQAEGL